ncbi:MAG: peptidylprolyl isomerase [Phycisphaerae bacterium]|nr:peptidylprolyl isomerase [Phycisphaerae bacterium]
MQTSKGLIRVELYQDKAPITVENFLKYTKEGLYNGKIFHRVIKGFMIQGGGITTDMVNKIPKPPIKNESYNKLRNTRGTLAMARQKSPDSATNQFFINHVDNKSLDFDGPYKPGYAVFGKVIKGMEVVDQIASVKTNNSQYYDEKYKQNVPCQNVPVEPIVIESVTLVIPEKTENAQEE